MSKITFKKITGFDEATGAENTNGWWAWIDNDAYGPCKTRAEAVNRAKTEVRARIRDLQNALEKLG